MFIAAIITLTLFILGLLLSMVKYANIADLLSDRTIYYSTNVTILVNTAFDVRYYSTVNIHIMPQATQQYSYNAFLCQVPCTNEIVTTVPIDFPGTVSTIDFNGLDFVRFPGLDHPRIPGKFMLKRSGIKLTFTHIDGDVFPNSTVTLSVFTNVDDCMCFRNRNPVKNPPLTTKVLTQRENFEYDFVATTNDYICIVIEIPVHTIFNYSAKGSISQYHDLPYLSDRSVCESITSTTFETPSEQGTTISLPLSRPFSRTSAWSPQHSCVLIMVTDNDSPVYSVFETNSTVFGTNLNVGVVFLAVSVFVLLLIALILLFVCVYTSR